MCGALEGQGSPREVGALCPVAALLQIQEE